MAKTYPYNLHVQKRRYAISFSHRHRRTIDVCVNIQDTQPLPFRPFLSLLYHPDIPSPFSYYYKNTPAATAAIAPNPAPSPALAVGTANPGLPVPVPAAPVVASSSMILFTMLN